MWVRTCEYLRTVQWYYNPVLKKNLAAIRCHYGTEGENLLHNIPGYQPGPIVTHVLNIDFDSLVGRRYFHPKPKEIIVSCLENTKETEDALIVHANSIAEQVQLPYGFVHFKHIIEKPSYSWEYMS